MKRMKVCKKSGFTLLEMLVVMGILGMLMASAYMGLSRAQRLARIAKANSDMRQLIGAWFAYEAANDDWPTNMPDTGEPVDADESRLAVLLGKSPDHSGKNHVYLNVPIRNGFFRDPWGIPYRLRIKKEENSSETEMGDRFSAAVTFPNRNRPLAR